MQHGKLRPSDRYRTLISTHNTVHPPPTQTKSPTHPKNHGLSAPLLRKILHKDTLC
ncbi:uncharacterized protein BDW47DRAFT_106223 [Aspergillus candidus]|uniref:Uncharacterized protein n=1 Tax=Aspergillus candidus TaxID=41067 RepID=A0A2I2FAU8_ASPCN|nr:hypothetical protein BDW47DRAFT_106223 [Aspergillus candidus]PLB37742.1 hypothetical protein BDW47DRAFT_106223 [Aspergillus candidus]